MTPAAPPAHPSSLEALRYWFWLGCISFGGPAGQIALMHQELVEKRRWISERRFLHALNYCMVLPGPEAQQLATYLGWLLHGRWGGLAAGGLFVLPSLCLLIALSWLYMAFGQAPAVAGLLYGVKPAVTAIIVFAAWRIGQRTLRKPWLWAIALAAFAAGFLFDAPFPLVILLAAACGLIGQQLAPAYFSSSPTPGKPGASALPALIDDDTPTPPHARHSTVGALRTLGVSLALWGGSIAALGAVFGATGLFAQLAWFFSKAAMLTFGGAYAVLPYVYDAAVEHFGWLAAGQMIDGLALGESTPGPLIIVTAFVGFVAGWNMAPLGPEHLVATGVLGALVVAFFTFLPSFVFIFLGAPLIERTHGNLRLAAPLSAITAAVVAFIGKLALFFATHVYWPEGLGAAFDWPAALIGGLALLALFRWPGRMLTVLALSAVAGLLLSFSSPLLSAG